VVAKKMLEVALNNEVGVNYYRLDEISCWYCDKC
jgi:hypothetical protein